MYHSVASCPLGEKFLTSENKCEKCGYGYYQDETGQTTCKSCNDAYTTVNNGSESSDHCIRKYIQAKRGFWSSFK